MGYLNDTSETPPRTLLLARVVWAVFSGWVEQVICTGVTLLLKIALNCTRLTGDFFLG